eukprot:g10195.t1
MKHRKSIARLLGSFLSRRSCRASLVPFIGGEIWATALAGTDSGDRVRGSSHPQDLVPSSSQEPYLASRPRSALESATVIAAKPPEETPEREVSSSADGKSVAASAQSQQEQPLWATTTTQLSDAERQAIADFHSARSYALSRQRRPRRRPTHEDAPSPPPPTEENFYVLETGGMPRPRAFLRKLQAGAGPEVVTK